MLIGDQCWFAENLRSVNYANGDSIHSKLTDSEWTSTKSGAFAIYGEETALVTIHMIWVLVVVEVRNMATSTTGML